MRRTMAAACLALTMFAGCSKSSEALMQRQIALNNEMADLLDAGKNLMDLGPLGERIEEVEEQLARLPEGDLEALEGKYAADLSASRERVAKAMQKQFFGADFAKQFEEQVRQSMDKASKQAGDALRKMNETKNEETEKKFGK